MIYTNLFIIKIINNDCKYVINLLNELQKKTYNQNFNNIFLFDTINDIPNIISKKFDRVYKNSSTNSVFQIYGKKDFEFDNLIQIISISKINVDYIFYLLKNPDFYVSDDELNIICRIIPKTILDNNGDLTKISYRRFLKKNRFKIKPLLLKEIPDKILYKYFSESLAKNMISTSVYKNKVKDFGLVSVIITCFNSENTIEYSIKSILNQTYKNIDIIIVDDASQDDTLKILKNITKNYKNIILIENKYNYGCYYSKNLALQKISKNSKFITFHDSDDISKPKRIEKQINFLEEKKFIACSCLGYYKNIIKVPMISFTFRTIVFEKLGFFNINRFGCDEDYHYRFFSCFDKSFQWNIDTLYVPQNKNGLFATFDNYGVLKEVLYNIYQQEKSLTKIYNSDLRNKLSIQLRKKYKYFLKKGISNYWLDFNINDNYEENKDINEENIDELNEINSTIENIYKSYHESISELDYESNFSFDVPSYSEQTIENDIIDDDIFCCTQVYISKSLIHLKKRFLDKFNLSEYYDKNLPSLFFGVYNEDDINNLENHLDKKYIIWGGTDFDDSFEYRKNLIDKILKIPNIILHYGISDNLCKRLEAKKLNYKKIYLNLVDKSLFKKANFFGKSIFIYNGLKENNEEIYNKKIYEQVIKELPEFNFILSNKLNADYQEMPNIYSQCFIALRLTNKDGNANMVQELNEMDIPVIHNGEYKSIKWNNKNDILKSIRDTYAKNKYRILNFNKSVLKKNINKNILIIFDKDLSINDGSLAWLENFSNMFLNNQSNVTIICRKYNSFFNSKINFIDNMNLSLVDFKNFDYIFYREYYNILNLEKSILNKIVICINYIENHKIDYYKQFKFVIAQSKLIKDELIFKGFSSDKITIIPPLISDLNIIERNNRKITFIYSGTLKKEYLSLELLILLEKLSKIYQFKFNILYGKIKNDDDSYNDELLKIINKLKLNSNFTILYNQSKNEVFRYIKKSDFGIVIHGNNIDKKQQSTKLIEYLSLNCIPIKSLNYLNSGYVNNEDKLTFEDLYELEDIFESILTGKLKKNDYKVNFENLKNHFNDYNLLKIYEMKDNNKFSVSNILINDTVDILVSNVIDNKTKCKTLIYLDVDESDLNIHGELIKKFIFSKETFLSEEDVNILEKKISMFIFNRRDYCVFNNMNIYKYYDIKNINYIFDYKIDFEKLNLINCKIEEEEYSFSKNSYLSFNLDFCSEKIYLIEFEINTTFDGYLMLNVFTYFNGKYQDINRNLHIVQKNNKSTSFTVKILNTDNYQLRVRPSCKNGDLFNFKIINLRVSELVNINKYCNEIKVINMDHQKNKFYNQKSLFEKNFITITRSLGVNGNTQSIKNQFTEYSKIPFNSLEKKLGRKLIVSPGGFGYLYSMKNIFRQAIINNYEYLMICDDDIALIENFIIKFTDLLKSINKPKILMLGSSQWSWENINLRNNYYYPDNNSNGSFCNIYHRSTFEKIFYNIVKFDSPFDSYPMKSIFNDGNCFVSYPNLAIAQLEESNIFTKKNLSRNYDRFKWDIKKYNFAGTLEETFIMQEVIKERKHDKLFILGITTFNRCNYLRDNISSIISTLDDKSDYIIIIADGCSKDKTDEVIKEFDFNDNVSLVIIKNALHYIYRQTNSIMKYAMKYDFDLGFVINDDILFLKKFWLNKYYNAYLKNKIDHLVFFDKNFKNTDHIFYNSDKTLISYVCAKNCQGALFTFTKKLINDVGYFDEVNFNIRGHSHIDFTIRCCRLNFNNIDMLYDVIDSNLYVKLNDKQYISSFIKLPLLLREFYKVDIYEMDKRIKILEDQDRKKINIDFNINF